MVIGGIHSIHFYDSVQFASAAGRAVKRRRAVLDDLFFVGFGSLGFLLGLLDLSRRLLDLHGRRGALWLRAASG